MDIKEKRIILIMGSSQAANEDTARILATAGCLLSRDRSATCGTSPFHHFHAHVLAVTGHASAADWAFPETGEWVAKQKRFRDELVVILESLFTGSTADAIAVADPLVTELIPLWTSVANAFGCKLDIVFAYQRPQLAAGALADRHGVSPLMAEALFLRHASTAAALKRPITIFNHDRYLNKPRIARQLIHSLGLKAPRNEAVPALADRRPSGPVGFRTRLVGGLLQMTAAGCLPQAAAKKLVQRICQSWPNNSGLRAQLSGEANAHRQADYRRWAAAKWPGRTKTPRIALVIPRVYGMLGTQGSYGLAAAFSAMTPTLVISRINDGSVQIPVVASSSDLTMHHAVDFSLPEASYEIAAMLDVFAPDIVHFINDHCWSRMVPAFKARCPNAKFVLDLKTPLLAEGAKRRQLHKDGRKPTKIVDLVISLSREIAQSWIPEYQGRFLEYPLGIIRAQILQRNGPVPSDPVRARFVYIGQTHPKRQLSKLLDFVSRLNPNVRGRFCLDIYGAGAGNEEIDAQIEALGLKDTVCRKEPLPQNELFQKLTAYDCGIAWVPNEIFGEAPSLKFLEYATAKLAVIATDTPAHRRNLNSGFHAELFQETAGSFATAVETIMKGGFTSYSVEQNHAVTERYDLHWIAANVLLPAYREIIEMEPQEESLGQR
jgi:glycosyltransferase involved in cell wall biosynthesis